MEGNEAAGGEAGEQKQTPRVSCEVKSAALFWFGRRRRLRSQGRQQELMQPRGAEGKQERPGTRRVFLWTEQ